MRQGPSPHNSILQRMRMRYQRKRRLKREQAARIPWTVAFADLLNQRLAELQRLIRP